MNKRGYIQYLILSSLLLVIALSGFVYTGKVTSDTKFCVDTDNGESIYTKGICTYSGGKLRDSCTSINVLSEVFCTSDGKKQYCFRESITCPKDYYCLNVLVL